MQSLRGRAFGRLAELSMNTSSQTSTTSPDNDFAKLCDACPDVRTASGGPNGAPKDPLATGRVPMVRYQGEFRRRQPQLMSWYRVCVSSKSSWPFVKLRRTLKTSSAPTDSSSRSNHTSAKAAIKSLPPHHFSRTSDRRLGKY